ncbi:unnamed protein product, partial [Gongylonema pulchrum]|uniref:Serine/threonine-protein kinase TOR n=1 Tax=Gongylonema pulchrum TaxID=637853 RepID=A0A183EEQ6_9BILA
MDRCMCCCAPCKPRYRRLLTFFAISRPEKLDRIGEYIVARLARDLYHQRYNQVKISVEAMDQLLQSCHDLSSLNQFIGHFLRMLQKLLETNDFQMEKLATDSFVNFANIEENTPAYHREYDFFISKFASMCHANSSSQNAKDVRYAGLRGLRGVMWKSATDPLQTSIWEKEHMDKIIPSILFNLQDDEDSGDVREKGKRFSIIDQPYPMDGVAESPKALADQFLRVKDPSFVIQALITHLENMSTSNASVRIGIAIVLSSIVSVAGTSIGPSLIGIFNSLLKHLRQSVEFQQTKECPSEAQEKIYQESLINAMGDYAYALPDYQKVEIMLFISANIPNLGKDSRVLKPSDAFLQHILVKTLLKVATKYKTGFMSTIFANNFPNTLLRLAVSADPVTRLDTQNIFHTLLD